MKNKSISGLLMVSLLVLLLVPLTGAMFFLDQTLETNLNLAFNQDVKNTIQHHLENLKKLKTLDPDNEAIYRQQFEATHTLDLVYQDSNITKQHLFSSLKLYFAIGTFSFIILALIGGILIHRTISRRYKNLFEDWKAHSQRVQTLQNLTRWQDFAKMLAHEIKNPLTPIDILVSSLNRSYELKTPIEFRDHLRLTQGMIQEELSHLKNLVQRFSEFARIPELQCVPMKVSILIDQISETGARLFPEIKIHHSHSESILASTINIDPLLLRLVFTNLFKNGIEANPEHPLEFNIFYSQSPENSELLIDLSNSGKPVLLAIAENLFEPAVSTHKTNDNMGLGLALTKKILIAHQGDIVYFEKEGYPHFCISLPLEVSHGF